MNLARISDAEILGQFPIESQTSLADKDALLKLRDWVGASGSYSYLEIGSYLGGSLVPFLGDSRCTRVLSVDDRGRQQHDERGMVFDYCGVTSSDMLARLKSSGVNVEKLLVFDGSINSYKPSIDLESYQLIFIDGEHTDRSCLRDFLCSRVVASADSIYCFHDSTVVWKAISIINTILAAQGVRFSFGKVSHSEMSVFCFGRYADVDLSTIFSIDDPEAFYARSEALMLGENFKNRLIISVNDGKVSFSLRPPQVKSAR